jgi:hypothetical protein
MPKPAKPVGAKSQIERFRETARELGADESEEAFDAALKKVAKEPPPPKEPKSPNRQGMSPIFSKAT